LGACIPLTPLDAASSTPPQLPSHLAEGASLATSLPLSPSPRLLAQLVSAALQAAKVAAAAAAGGGSTPSDVHTAPVAYQRIPIGGHWDSLSFCLAVDLALPQPAEGRAAAAPHLHLHVLCELAGSRSSPRVLFSASSPFPATVHTLPVSGVTSLLLVLSATVTLDAAPASAAAAAAAANELVLQHALAAMASAGEPEGVHNSPSPPVALSEAIFTPAVLTNPCLSCPKLYLVDAVLSCSAGGAPTKDLDAAVAAAAATAPVVPPTALLCSLLEKACLATPSSPTHSSFTPFTPLRVALEDDAFLTGSSAATPGSSSSSQLPSPPSFFTGLLPDTDSLLPVGKKLAVQHAFQLGSPGEPPAAGRRLYRLGKACAALELGESCRACGMWGDESARRQMQPVQLSLSQDPRPIHKVVWPGGWVEINCDAVSDELFGDDFFFQAHWPGRLGGGGGQAAGGRVNSAAPQRGGH
jgi:hypothetical protein